nr:cell division protein FtsI [uncultured Roseateles sp.]
MKMNIRTSAGVFLAVISALQTGCSIFSPIPLWELTKAAGVAAGQVVPYGTTKASNTVYHGRAEFRSLCIEFNPNVGVPDVVPALQRELQKHHIESRLYMQGTLLDECVVWLRYTALIAWDVPPIGSAYQPYITTAALTLQSSKGAVLSSSNYQQETTLGMGKWASTQQKLAPVVAALLSGLEE